MKLIGATLTWGLATLIAAVTLPRPADDATASEAALVHIVLDSSGPRDEFAGAGPVSEVRLFFSGAPLMRGASVRVVTSARQLMRTSPPAADPLVDVRRSPSRPDRSAAPRWELRRPVALHRRRRARDAGRLHLRDHRGVMARWATCPACPSSPSDAASRAGPPPGPPARASTSSRRSGESPPRPPELAASLGGSPS